MPIFNEFSPIRSQSALTIFCRAPRLGTVKTRLAQSMSNHFALGLYTAMLHDTFALGRALAPSVETFACFTPPDAFHGDASLKSLWNGLILPQSDGDLGQRMLNCLNQLRAQGYQKTVLIGSDSPDLPLSILQEAFELLRHSPITLGKSEDGGFYLLGTSTSLPDKIFEGITWSSPHVAQVLEENLQKQQLQWSQLPTWRDVDDEDDLKALQHRLLTQNTHAPHTRRFLMSNSK